MCRKTHAQDYAAGQWLSEDVIQRRPWPQPPCFGAPSQLCIGNCVGMMRFVLFWRRFHRRTVETQRIESVWTASGKKKDLISRNYFSIREVEKVGLLTHAGQTTYTSYFYRMVSKKLNTLSINYVLWSLLLPEVTFCSSVVTSVVGPVPSIQSNSSSIGIIDGFGVVCVSDNWEYAFLLDFPILSTCLDEIQGTFGTGYVYL